MKVQGCKASSFLLTLLQFIIKMTHEENQMETMAYQMETMAYLPGSS